MEIPDNIFDLTADEYDNSNINKTKLGNVDDIGENGNEYIKDILEKNENIDHNIENILNNNTNTEDGDGSSVILTNDIENKFDYPNNLRLFKTSTNKTKREYLKQKKARSQSFKSVALENYKILRKEPNQHLNALKPKKPVNNSFTLRYLKVNGVPIIFITVSIFIICCSYTFVMIRIIRKKTF